MCVCGVCVYIVHLKHLLSFFFLKIEEVFKRLPGFKKIFVLEFRYDFYGNLYDYAYR